MNRNNPAKLRAFLEEQVDTYNRPAFIENDPISIPHRFRQLQDIEISGFVAAVLAWGQRKTIINKCTEFLGYMDNAPYDFVRFHREADLKPFLNFKHRTFNNHLNHFLLELSSPKVRVLNLDLVNHVDTKVQVH